MISSYCSTETSVSDISGLNFLSLISTLLLDFLSIQFKSAFEIVLIILDIYFYA